MVDTVLKKRVLTWPMVVFSVPCVIRLNKTSDLRASSVVPFVADAKVQDSAGIYRPLCSIYFSVWSKGTCRGLNFW